MWISRLLLIGFCAFVAYEGWLVRQAYKATPDILKNAISPQDLRWSDLTNGQQTILITVEDPAFFDHNGVDFLTPGAGLTTLTQAVVKRLYFDRFQPGFQKIEQTLIARLVVNRLIPKEDQLSLFLNHAYFGQTQDGALIGFPAAAAHFFGKPVLALTEAEYLSLVATLIAPNAYAPGTPRNAERTARLARYIAGGCAPANNGDVWLPTCVQ